MHHELGVGVGQMLDIPCDTAIIIKLGKIDTITCTKDKVLQGGI